MQTTHSIKSRQRQFVEEMRATGYEPAVVADKPFLRGIRDLGYKDPGYALDELIDNPIEAAAENIAVVFGCLGGSDKKPTHIAIADDGVGMPPELIRAAVVWGGTDRENSRELFGRYGFGLPSACVSLGERYEVYSKQDGKWFYVPMFLDEIFADDPRYKDEKGRVVPPKAVEKAPPKWVFDEVSRTFDLKGVESGTVVVISNLDRDGFKTTSKWEGFLLEHFGTIYRNYIGSVRITVNGTETEIVDPLFLNPKGRYFAENSLRAQELPPLEIPVRYKDEKGNRGDVAGVIRVRFSYLPAGFQNKQLEDGTFVPGRSEKGLNNRFKIMKANNGILFLRAGRQIDIVNAKCPWITFVNYDRNWKVEVDFPPLLDDMFSITTSKQQVVPSERFWAILEEHGVDKVIEQLRAQYKVDRLQHVHMLEEEAERREDARTSEEVMEEASRFKTGEPPIPKERQKEAEKHFEDDVEKKSIETGRSKDEVRKELEADTAERAYVIRYERVKGAPFYRPEWYGSQIRVWINQEHTFFTDVYRGPDATPRMRAALEMLLFIMGERELRCSGDAAEFYLAERMEWSRNWDRALRFLENRRSVVDESSADDASAEALDDAEKARSED